MEPIECSKENVGGDIQTCVPVTNYTFEWVIENYSKIPISKRISSPDFNTSSTIQCHLDFEKNSLQKLHLLLCLPPNLQARVESDISILDSRRQLRFNTTSCTISTGNIGTNNSHFLLFTDIDYKTLNNYTDDVVIFIGILKIYLSNITTVTTLNFQPVLEVPYDGRKSLSTDMQKLFDSSLDADITLHINGHTLLAHKSILCARSTVFSELFVNTPRTISVIDIANVEFSVMKNLVSFLYSGIVNNIEFDTAFSLYKVADKYAVSDLRQTCCNIMLCALDDENACRALMLAHHHNDGLMKVKILHFIRFRINSVVVTKTWDDLISTYNDLAVEAQKFCVKKHV